MPPFERPGTVEGPPAPPAVIQNSLEGADREREIEEGFRRIKEAARSPAFNSFIDRRFFEFVATRRRIPALGDDPPPFKYSGWMLWYIWLANMYHPEVVNRWGYYFDQLEAGRLTDAPIPQISFVEIPSPNNRAARNLKKVIEQIGRRHGYGQRALDILVDWLAWSTGTEKTEPTYINDELSEWLYRNFELDDLLLHPHDYLGDALQEVRGKSAQWTGFFLTPHNVCELMVRMVYRRDPDIDTRAQVVMEPACGTSRFLLHQSNFSLRLFGVDIDPVCVKISKINGALYAPWLAFPLPPGYFGPLLRPGADGIETSNALTPMPAGEGAADADRRGAPAPTVEPSTFAPATPQPQGEASSESPQTAGATTESTPRQSARKRKYRTDDNAQGLLFNPFGGHGQPSPETA